MNPRFVVRSITGYPITASERLGSNQKPSTSWWVADTAYCYREVSLWKPEFDYRRGRGYPKQIGAKLTFHRSVAEFTAAKLNAEATP